MGEKSHSHIKITINILGKKYISPKKNHNEYLKSSSYAARSYLLMPWQCNWSWYARHNHPVKKISTVPPISVQFHQSQYTNIDMSRQIMSAKYNPAHTQDDITSSTKFRTNIYYFIEMSTCAQEEKYNNNFQTKNVSRHGPRGDGGVENYFQSFRCRWRRVDHLWGEADGNGTSWWNLAIVSYKSWWHWQYIDWYYRNRRVNHNYLNSAIISYHPW